MRWACVLKTARLRSTMTSLRLTPCFASRSHTASHTCTLRVTAPRCSQLLLVPPTFMPPHTPRCPILHFRAPTSCTRWWRRATPSARPPRLSTPSVTSSSSSSGAGESLGGGQQRVSEDRRSQHFQQEQELAGNCRSQRRVAEGISRQWKQNVAEGFPDGTQQAPTVTYCHLVHQQSKNIL